MTAFCPSCGLDLQKQERLIERGPWTLAVDHTQYLGDLMRQITPQMSAFLYTLALLRPEYWVGREAMGNRIARDPEAVTAPGNLACVIAFNLRKSLGENAPFESHHRFGYCWKDAA